MIKFVKSGLLASIICLSLNAPSAFASLIGDQIEGCLRNPFDSPGACDVTFTNQFFAGSPGIAPTATVGAGTEFIYEVGGIAQARADFDGNSVTILQNNAAGPFGWGFRNLDWVDSLGNIIPGRITGVNVSDPTGLLESFSFGDHELFFFTGANTSNITRSVTLTFETEHAAVSEPGMVAVLGASILGLGYMRWRRPRQRTLA